MCRLFSFSAGQFPSQCGLLQNTNTERLDKIKIANISNMKFLIVAYKTNLLSLIEINVLLLALIYRQKSVGINKGKERSETIYRKKN